MRAMRTQTGERRLLLSGEHLDEHLRGEELPGIQKKRRKEVRVQGGHPVAFPFELSPTKEFHIVI